MDVAATTKQQPDRMPFTHQNRFSPIWDTSNSLTITYCLDALHCIHCVHRMPAIVLMYRKWDKATEWSRVHGARNRLVMENI